MKPVAAFSKTTKKSVLIKGTLFLTVAGFLTRFIGFFYRIFLSHTFGEEGMGIYQLTGPVSAIVYSVSTAGIQSAISKFTASSLQKDSKSRLQLLLTGFSLSALLSICLSFVIYSQSEFIAVRFLMEPRCAPLLRIMALSYPPACVHCCINGYYFGIQKTEIPSFSQLIEQIFRTGTVFLLWQYSSSTGIKLSITAAAIGLVIGEIASTLVTLTACFLHFSKKLTPGNCPPLKRGFAWGKTSRQLLGFAAPLSLNRLCLNFLGALEAAWIPARLQLFGYSTSQALSIYGVLTGMAMTLILFPGTLTNSVSVLLMPLIAQADSSNNRLAIRQAIIKCIKGCLLLGFTFLVIFLFGGQFFGKTLFDSELAGRFIMTLSFICPFLYLGTTLASILNGLGKTGYTFLVNLCSMGIRLLFVFCAIPGMGIEGYLIGLLICQLFSTAAFLLLLRPYVMV